MLSNDGVAEYFRENVLSVSDLNGLVKELIDNVPVFSSLRVRGEISNFKNHSSGHMYFSLKDGDSAIKAVMFRRECERLRFVPENGMKVVASGRVSVFVRDGAYQLYVSDMTPDGRGELYAAYERLKKKLGDEGLFSEAYKKKIPAYPERIGVITSPTGAAVRDIINVSGSRWKKAEITVYPALVQGEGAEASLIEGVRVMTDSVRPDVVIIGRGGGSIEDLWAFNSEKLARAIAASDIPFISAVGHETDYTICDFVSSVRASTPSHAAEIATPDARAVLAGINSAGGGMAAAINKKLSEYALSLSALTGKRVIRSPYGFIDEKAMLLDRLTESLTKDMILRTGRCRETFKGLCGKLDALSPLAVLSRGYGAVYGEDGKVVTSVSGLHEGNALTIRMSDGTVGARVTNVNAFDTKASNRGAFDTTASNATVSNATASNGVASDAKNKPERGEKSDG